MQGYFVRFAVISVFLVAGCGGKDVLDVDLGEFTALPRIENLDYSKITPAEQHRYWELRLAFSQGSGTDQILGAGGEVARAQLGAATIAELDAIRPNSGFSIGCLPGNCFKFVAAVNGSVSVFRTTDELVDFLGNIDSVEEAALVADAHGYYWDQGGEFTGAKETSRGWEIVALQLVRDCAPVQTDRVQLRIDRGGAVSEIGREVYERTENACI